LLPDRKVKWGILGTARIALRAVIPAIQQSTNGTVIGIASRSSSKALETAKSLGIRNSYASYIELLNSPEIDAVYIPLPNNMHREFAVIAAEKGKHVLCEKPLAINSRECEEMIHACEHHHVWLMEAFMYRFHPQISKLKEIVDSGSIGKIAAFRAAFRTSQSDPSDIRFQKDLGGGSLMDVGCYCINVMRQLVDAEPTVILGIARFDGKTGVDETFTGILRFPGLEIGLFDCGFRSTLHQRLEVMGDKGTLEVLTPFLAGNSPRIILHGMGGEEELAFDAANSYKLMVEHFNQSILNDHPPLFPPIDGLNNMRVIDALFESAARIRTD